MGNYVGIIVDSEADRPEVVEEKLFADDVVEDLYEIYQKNYADVKEQYDADHVDNYEETYGKMMTLEEFTVAARATTYSATLQCENSHIDYVVEYAEVE